ncbi:MAG: phosphotransferase [Ornithinimicrobium sp.]
MRRSDLALAGIACAAVPGMKPTSVREVSRRSRDEQLSHQTAIVEDSTGRTWVVRVPLSTVAGAELERNESLVAQLGKHLPFKAPAAIGYASLGPDQPRAAVYPYVEGSAINLHGIPAGPGLASAIGRAIAAIHNIPREIFEEHDVPAFDAAAHRELQISELDRAAATGVVPTGLLARWEQAFEASALWQFSSTPVHGALTGGAFLVAFADDDASTGRVVALTHWDQACVTDPAQDFAAMVDQLTPAAFDSVIESYSLARSSRPDSHLIQRARLAAEMRLISGLAQAVSANSEEVVQDRIDELRKLDRLTAADNSLVPSTAPAQAEQTPPPQRTGLLSDEVALPVEAEDNGADDQIHHEPDHGAGADQHDDDEPRDRDATDIDAEEDDDQYPVEVDPTTDAAFVPITNATDSDNTDVFEITDAMPTLDLDDEDVTESLPRVTLGDELEDSDRLHDLYDVPEDEFETPDDTDAADAAAGADVANGSGDSGDEDDAQADNDPSGRPRDGKT